MRQHAYPTLDEATAAAREAAAAWFAYLDPELGGWGWYPRRERLGAGRWVKEQWIAETDEGPVEVVETDY